MAKRKRKNGEAESPENDVTPNGVDEAQPATDTVDVKAKAAQFVEQRRPKYFDALAEAKAAAETTSSSAWITVYRQAMTTHRAIVMQRIGEIREACDNISDHGTKEDTEKVIKEATKGVADEREKHEAWHKRSVQPFSDKVERCGEIRRAIIQAAEDAERESPITDDGLTGATKAIVDTWPEANWHEGDGIVSIRPPKVKAEGEAPADEVPKRPEPMFD